MLKLFLSHLKNNSKFTSKDVVLLAVSGGMDSMAMCNLFQEAGQPFAVAHCNFGLRGDESDQDEVFLANYCSERKIVFHSKKFNTQDYAAEKKISIQMAARELRYQWFIHLANENNYKFICTAHHANDQAETFFINLLRGAGINGLKGIPSETEHFFRPLLPFTRSQIADYVTTKQIAFREDSSNQEEKYLRNFIRKNLYPVLQEINPSWVETINRDMRYIHAANVVLEKQISQWKENFVSVENGEIKIALRNGLSVSENELLLHHMLNPLGFTSEQCMVIAAYHNLQSGAAFHSEKHHATYHRNHLYIKTTARDNADEKITWIEKHNEEIHFPISLSLHFESGAVIKKEQHTACFDAKKVQFPIYIRKWKSGDHFFPLGMKGRKKLSDYFVSEKLNRFQKETTYLLCSGENILWVIGHRMDDRFKVNPETEETLVVTIR